MIKKRITYSNVMATIAVFIALGGAGYAAAKLPANSVDTAQLRKEAVTAAKIKDGAVTGAKVDLRSLGTVPSAARATNAGHAASAGSADDADHATKADTADRASQADTATDAAHAATANEAQTLGGRTASQILAAAKPTCPTGTKLERGLCFETAPRGPSILDAAVGTCASENRQLPTVEEIVAFQSANFTTKQPEEWSSQMYVEGKVRWAFTAQILGGAFTIGTKNGSEALPYRCVLLPT
jgi:hypothetical protein